jgi:hypothetical protein
VSEEFYEIGVGVFIDNYHFLKEKLSAKDYNALDMNTSVYFERIWAYGLGFKKPFG